MKKINISCIENILLLTVSNGEEIVIYNDRIDLPELIDWLLSNEFAIKNDPIPCGLIDEKGKSIAAMVEEFYESLDPDTISDEIIDIMYDYRAMHGLRFGCLGTNFPNIYVGKNGNKHEISLCTEVEAWKYLIDIDDFFFKVHKLCDQQVR